MYASGCNVYWSQIITQAAITQSLNTRLITDVNGRLVGRYARGKNGELFQ